MKPKITKIKALFILLFLAAGIELVSVTTRFIQKTTQYKPKAEEAIDRCSLDIEVVEDTPPPPTATPIPPTNTPQPTNTPTLPPLPESAPCDPCTHNVVCPSGYHCGFCGTLGPRCIITGNECSTGACIISTATNTPIPTNTPQPTTPIAPSIPIKPTFPPPTDTPVLPEPLPTR